MNSAFINRFKSDFSESWSRIQFRAATGVVVFVSLLLATGLFAQERNLVRVTDIQKNELRTAGFELNSEQEIHIDAAGIKYDSGEHEVMLVNAWILNSATREVVWDLEKDYREQKKKYRFILTTADKKLRLPGGRYEVYYASFPYTFRYDDWDGVHGIGDVFSLILDGIFHGWHEDRDARRRFREWNEKLGIRISGSGQPVSEAEVARWQDDYRKNAIISMSPLGDSNFDKKGITLDKPLDLKVYALGEARRDNEYDYGWIVNSATREKVWEFNYRSSDPAGGARKNRMERDQLHLDAGSYVVYYVTDDSHSPKEWNAQPPYDPQFWGITLLADNSADKSVVHYFDPGEQLEKNSIVRLTRARDDNFLSKSFTLTHPLSVQIYALGEGRDGEMFDYGWILDARTHQKVWQMKYYKSKHAGGAEKNRLADDIIELQPGSYTVYYATDGSHAYGDWNASPPFDPDNWGITIAAAEADYDPAWVREYQPEKDTKLLAQLIRIRDDERRYENFRLEKDTDVHIYGLGEGRHGDMYDYGWIEDAGTGRIVWQMRYRETDWAGGARKNRQINDTIFLKAGEYRLYYETDDSHAFNEWNDTPPYDPDNWGITIYAIKTGMK